jgi:hypothetical protein
VNKNEQTAAIPALFLSLIISGGGATLTPHFGQISALESISAPQLIQYFVLFQM